MKCEKCKVNEARAYLYPAFKIVTRIVRDKTVKEKIPVDVERLFDRLEGNGLRKNICGDCIPQKFKRIAEFAFQEIA